MTERDTDTITAQIRAKMHAEGITQEQLAAMLDTKRINITQALNREPLGNSTMLHKIIATLGLKIVLVPVDSTVQASPPHPPKLDY